MLILNRSPLNSLAQMHNHLNQVFDSVFNDRILFDAAQREVPPMNIWEDESCFRIEAELPGYSMNDLEVTVMGDQVTIKGARQAPNVEGATYLRRERAAGTFKRTWTLPAEIDADRVEASLTNGILLLTLPKSP
jgi:HSP20 family protein